MKKKYPKIGTICRSECSAIGRYIGKGNVLFVSSMDNDLVTSPFKKVDKNTYNLPLPSNKDVSDYSQWEKHTTQ